MGLKPPLAAVACAMLASGCQTAPLPPQDATAPAPVAPAAPAWWQTANDPLLAALITQGLERNPQSACALAALQDSDARAARHARQIGAKLGRLLQPRSSTSDSAQRAQRADQVAARRIAVAREIVLAYIEVRRLQQRVRSQTAFRDQYADNAQIAEFRRQAGLVPAIDGSLASSQTEIAQGGMDFASTRLDDAIAALGVLVGEAPLTLAPRLGVGGNLPELQGDPLADSAADDPMRGRLEHAALREKQLAQALEKSRHTVTDARIAYREGAATFATLYVAEAAALAMELALTDARAAHLALIVEVWSSNNADWARQGLEPRLPVAPDPTAPASGVTPCD